MNRFTIIRGGLWLPRRIFGAPRPPALPKPASSSEWHDHTDPHGHRKLRIADGWVRFLQRQRVEFREVYYREDPDRHITSPHVALVLLLVASKQLLVIANADTWQLRTQLERVYRKMGPRPFVHEDDADLRVVLGLEAGRYAAFGGVRGWDEEAGLYQCRECEAWYFVDQNGGWGCQCYGCDYAGNADLGETFSGSIPTDEWERAS